MRVIAGALRGRRLSVPRRDVRPTADRIREAVFSSLGDVEGIRVLDLYAGSGALGIEALSRGAADAVFVERGRAAVSVLRRNLAALGLEERARVIADDVERALRTLARRAEGGAGGASGSTGFDLVLADPPYACANRERVLAGLGASGLLRPGAVVVVESGRRHPLSAVAGLRSRRRRRYGDTVIHYLDVPDPPAAARRAGPAEEPAEPP